MWNHHQGSFKPLFKWQVSSRNFLSEIAHKGSMAYPQMLPKRSRPDNHFTAAIIVASLSNKCQTVKFTMKCGVFWLKLFHLSRSLLRKVVETSTRYTSWQWCSKSMLRFCRSGNCCDFYRCGPDSHLPVMLLKTQQNYLFPESRFV